MTSLFLLFILKRVYELLCQDVTLFKERICLGHLLTDLLWLLFAITHSRESLLLNTFAYKILYD